jgi:tRNA (guanine37-N1)-methyltransferase
MVLRADLTVEATRSLNLGPSAPVFVLDPAGELFTQTLAEELSEHEEWAVVCGRYEGFDERIIPLLNARPLSIGDFVLSGGELPALMMIDAAARLLPGALGDPESHQDDSHAGDGLLGFPLYTKPHAVEGMEPPSVLTGGHHGQIADWRRTEQLLRTRLRRPDLFARARLSPRDLHLLKKASEVPPQGP